jgi:hypothetical protein
MKWFYLAALLALMPAGGFARDSAAQDGPAAQRLWSLVQVAGAYDCRDVSCKRLSSCEEACYKLLACGQRKRDGDHDGIPCENLCARPCPR